MKATIPVIRTSIGQQFLQSAFIAIALLLACFGPVPQAQAVNPAPDGGYAGGNTAEGQNALFSLTSGTFNTAVGFLSLRGNPEGQFNTAIGAGTLLANTAHQNTATGAGALLSNTTGFANTANGAFALLSNTIGTNNTAAGGFALSSNTTGSVNVANGYAALSNNTVGSGNTATGDGALFNNTTGSFNTALGFLAGSNVIAATNVICIGSGGADVDDSCFIGNIFNRTSIEGTAVYVNSDGQLGTIPSSRRFKDHIKLMDQTSEALFALKPVTFHYKSDKTATPQFGLIAEEVAAVNPDLVVRDEKGEICTVRYNAVNAMLLNEFLKEHKKVEEQHATIADLKLTVAQQRRDFEAAIAQERKQSEATAVQQQKEIHVLIGSLKEQAVQIRNVSDQLQPNKPAPQMVLNNP